jgi:outer membrane protein OmpA-like peptidoglycan-associated protein
MRPATAPGTPATSCPPKGPRVTPTPHRRGLVVTMLRNNPLMRSRALAPARLALAAALALGLPGLALAAPAEGQAEGQAEADGDASASVELGARPKGKRKAKGDASAETNAAAEGDAAAETPASERPWIRRYTPRRNMWEVGFFGGLWLPASNLELYDRNRREHVRYDLSSQLGLRVGYYPLRHFGLEGELAMMPTRLETEQRAFVSTARAHAVVQLGLWRIVPYALIGGGVLSVRSEPDAAGRNGDEALHVGGGLKFFIKEHVMVRLDVRDVMSPKVGITPVAPAHSQEFTIGFTVPLGPRKPKHAPPPLDQDGDGFLDGVDACPTEAGVDPDGCPAKDSDGDGFLDRDDACVDQPGVAPDGCPIPDSDGDGFLDPDDACPDEPGVEPDGCPLRDVDGDGIYPPQDECPHEPETVNGFEDEDGCPDELPEEVKKYTGVIEGIYFDTAKATIRAKSYPTLDAAVKVLADYPALRVEISGHTDSNGKRDKNLVLSQDRANSVKAYLVGKGIAEDRIVTRGAGPDEPIGDNKTSSGRQMNRRIEFKLITGTAGTTPGTGAVACTKDAKICPDGSTVGREGPDCEFAPCPEEVTAESRAEPRSLCPKVVRECSDGSFVGRAGANCEWRQCPDEVAADPRSPRTPKRLQEKKATKSEPSA